MSDQERLDALEAEGVAMHTPENAWDLAKTMAEREDKHRVWREARAERRERIATQVYAALMTGHLAVYLANRAKRSDGRSPPVLAVQLADELLAALDAAEARDREATK